MAGSTTQASSAATRGAAVKRSPSSSTSTPPTASKKSKTSLIASSRETITPVSSPSLPVTFSMGSNVTKAEATTTANNTPRDTRVTTRATPNQTADLINAYSEINNSFSALIERLKKVNHERNAQVSTSSLSKENHMFLASVEESLIDTMRDRLAKLAARFR